MERHEIMTVEEVADYLRVAERTVYDWAKKGRIPCGKIGTTWRFMRSEIDRWLEQRLAPRKQPASEVGSALALALRPERVTLLDCDGKAEALNALIDVLATAPEVQSRDELAEAIFRREELMSTGIGLGMAVPHVRLTSVKDIVAAAGICRRPIADYDSLDGRPVEFIFMIAAGIDQHARHIKLLSQISTKLKDAAWREFLLRADSAEAAYRLLTS